MNGKRLVAARTNDGHIITIKEEIPPLRPGTVLVEVHNSLVSPGTEVGGWRALRQLREHPLPPGKPQTFGYSNAGVVREVGDGVEGLAPGEHVACIGVGYALHATYAVVPHHLCVALPEAVSFTQGSYAMLAATALHAVRRGQPELGEFVSVVGLGLLGQLCARLYQMAGAYVIGWDLIPFRAEIARQWGIDAAVVIGEQDEMAATHVFTGGQGLDAALFAFGGDANQTLASTERCLKCAPDGHPQGRIVIVGNPHFNWPGPGPMTNTEILRASRTGPGYHDEDWEIGADYPPVFMRWTTQTNLRLCMRLIAEGKLDVDVLTTHTIRLAEVDEGISAALQEPDRMLGVVFEMEQGAR